MTDYVDINGAAVPIDLSMEGMYRRDITTRQEEHESERADADSEADLLEFFRDTQQPAEFDRCE